RGPPSGSSPRAAPPPASSAPSATSCPLAGPPRVHPPSAGTATPSWSQRPSSAPAAACAAPRWAAGADPAMLAVHALEKSYGARALVEGVSFDLAAGARYGLVGANGSGKTTFLNILAGDDPPTAGSVTLPRDARLGVLRQDRFLDDEEIILDVAMRGDQVV